ncbi:hypothetical protein [Archangium violaceum]|uniref:Uncharacterized protein n=1 Tax=Archangium violaceum Cb vi76 TaxID=1406225 RepID=A0A084SPC1_9BACT|nr:hypothetical protein [Archangium violaceum]KFA90306.1 hypothetical protein Q664_29260 [Archangium violaceum Cb vi76]
MTNPKWLAVAARSSGQHTWTLGYVFEKYREYESKSAEALAEELGCSLETLAWLSLCRRPSQEHFAEHLEQIGNRFEVEPHLLAAVIRHVEVLDRLPPSRGAQEEEGEVTVLLAARDHSDEGDEDDEDETSP